MRKFFKKLFSLLIFFAALASIAALIFYYFQRKDVLSDDTMEDLDNLSSGSAPEAEETTMQKFSRYSKDLLEKRSYIKIPFHD
jgi:hypothetical protein